MCSWSELREEESFGKILEETPDGSVLSVVSDAWDIYRACSYWNKLADRVKEKNVSLVIRPDSGEPTEVIPKMISILEKGFPRHKNDKGLWVFDNLKLLWGDGIDESNYLEVLTIMPRLGYGVENLIVGSGGGLMQKVNRDTMKWAFKASAVVQSNGWVPIRKDPITDPGKKSKAGKLETVIGKDGEVHTVDWTLATTYPTRLLETVYYYDKQRMRGVLAREQTMEQIRELVRA